MRVAIVSSTFPNVRPGGVPTYVEGRAAFLSRRCEVKVFALGSPSDGGHDGVGLGFNDHFGRTALAVWWRLVVAVWRYRPAHIEVHNIPVGLPLLFFVRAAYFFHGPAALEAGQEGAAAWKVASRRWLEKLTLWRATKVYVASNAYADLIRALHPRSISGDKRLLRRYPRLLSTASAEARSEGTPSGRWSHALHAQDASANRPLMLVCVRRLVRRTGVPELVEAFLQASAQGRLHPDTVLHIAGDGPLLPEIRDRIAQAAGCARLILHGRISDDQRRSLYGESDLNIVPTQALEGFGMVVVEAALEGCPSLVTNVGGLPEALALLDHVGLMCKPDVDSLREALANLRPFAPQDRRQLAEVAARRFLPSPAARQVRRLVQGKRAANAS